MTDDTFHVLQFTDTHIYADQSHLFGTTDTRVSLRRVLELASTNDPDPDLILLTGDLAAEAEPLAYAWLGEQFAALDVPVCYLPGNHDTTAAMAAPLGARGWSCCTNRLAGGWHFVLLDSSVAGAAHGYLDDTELRRLDESLESERDVPALVCLHHHPLPTYSAWLDTMILRNAGEFWAVIDKHPQVRAVVWGHVHQNYDSYRNDVRVLATPSTCVQFMPRSPNYATDRVAPGYRRLRLSRGGGIDTAVLRA